MADDNWIVDRIAIGPGLTKKHGRLDVNIADPRFTDPTLTTPSPHAYTHTEGGSDEVTLTMAQITGLIAALADAALGGLPAYTVDDARRILGVLDDGTLAWVEPDTGAVLFPRYYDSTEEYDTTTTYDAEFH